MPVIDKPGIYVWGDPENRWNITVVGSPSWTSPRPFEVTLSSLGGTFSAIQVTPSDAPSPRLFNREHGLEWIGFIQSGWINLRFETSSWVMEVHLYLDLDGDGVAKPATQAEAVAGIFLRSKKVHPPLHPFILMAPGRSGDRLLPNSNFLLARGPLSAPVVVSTIADLER